MIKDSITMTTALSEQRFDAYKIRENVHHCFKERLRKFQYCSIVNHDDYGHMH
jgi:hypothetical protein